MTFADSSTDSGSIGLGDSDHSTPLLNALKPSDELSSLDARESTASSSSGPGQPARDDVNELISQGENLCFFPFVTCLVPTAKLQPSNNAQRSSEEARLLRYFVTDLADWFDAADVHKHFASTIPELAFNCPALYYSILALSSKHLSIQGNLDVSVSLKYQDACYKALLPDLQERAFEAPYLAAVLMLRLALHMKGL